MAGNGMDNGAPEFDVGERLAATRKANGFPPVGRDTG
jgi:hypothetical protein